jgi:hypothetical protein
VLFPSPGAGATAQLDPLPWQRTAAVVALVGLSVVGGVLPGVALTTFWGG